MKPHLLRWFSAALGLLSGLSLSLVAQTSGSNDSNGEVTKLSTYVVTTGSNIPTAADATAVPVTVLGPQEIAETGDTANLLEILRKRLPYFSGRSNTGDANANNTNQNTAGGSQIALHNLDTLVLINGRRIATSGINAVGGKSFVDLNMIPAAAIERIEVLTDGASAIYGSDAIGGVINIILKSDYQGSAIGGRYAVASGAGNYTERSAYFVAGAGHNGVNLTVSGSWSKTDPLYQKDRPFSRNFYVKGFATFPGIAGGAYLNPALNSPSQKNPTGVSATAPNLAALIANGTYLAASDPSIAPGPYSQFNLAPYQTLLLSQDQRAIVADGSAELIGQQLVLFGDYLYARTKSFNQPFQSRNNFFSATVPAGAPYNPLTTAFPGVVFGNLATPLQIYNRSVGNRFTAGFRGALNEDWNWEAAYTYSDNKLTEQIKNILYTPNVARAVAGGYDASGNPVAGGAYSRVMSGFSEVTGTLVTQPALDPFARAGNSPASLANLYGTELIQTQSKLASYDVKLVGQPFSLPAGRLGFAVGAASRKETIAGTPDENAHNTGPTAQRWKSGIIFDPFTKSRTVDSYFGELRVPVTSATWNFPGFHALDLSLAGRAEKYSDVGNSNVPKIGLRWQPMDEQLTVRFTYSKGFTAPTLYNEFGPTDTRIVGSGVIQTVFGIANPGLQGEDGNNPDLKPSQAWSRSLGFVLTPKAVKGLTLSVDYYNVYQKGFPGGIGFTNILASVDQLGAASPFVSNFAFNNFPGLPGATAVTAPGQISSYLKAGGNSLNMYAVDHFVNLAGLHTSGYDLDLEYELPTDSLGKFTFSTTGTYLLSYQFQALPGQPFYEYAGYATNGGTGVQGTLPKYSFYTTIEWARHNWDLLLGNTYIPAVTDIGPGGIVYATSSTLKPVPVDSYTAWDFQVSYTIGQKTAANWWSYLQGTKLTVGINNIGNRMPPLAPQAFSDNNADVANYPVIGRLWFVSANVKF